MYIEKISLLNFKNYPELEVSFSKRINLLAGLNGSGKTNLLDAIYCLCLTKSFLASSDPQMMLTGAPYFSVLGWFYENAQDFKIQYDFDGKKKNFTVEKKPYSRLSDHIGRFPAVVLTPHDTDLIRDGAEERRRFFDTLFSQADHPYLEALIRYTHFIKQRNALLKQAAEGMLIDRVLMDAYDSNLLQANAIIAHKRHDYLQRLMPVFQEYYNLLSPEHETTDIVYETNVLSPDFEHIYKDAYKRDILLQRTTKGIHRDEFRFLIQNEPIKQFGSQGQQKTFVIALKLAQYELLRECTGHIPILLMDDIFDKLDDVRIEKLIELVKTRITGQLFISDARPDRSSKFFQLESKEFRMFNISHGMVEIAQLPNI
ncbi:MAG: DNA replication and repair protein RecF [Cytophagales bacterium]|nr:DNA replication and repair protein RecF [Cytophaga sp.]